MKRILLAGILSLIPSLAHADRAEKYCLKHLEKYPSFESCYQAKKQQGRERRQAFFRSFGRVLQGAGQGLQRPIQIYHPPQNYTCSRLGDWITCNPQ